MKAEVAEAGVISVASKTTYAGATTATLGWITSSEFGVLVGLVVAVLGLLTNLWFQHRRDRREQIEHEKRMKKLETRPGDLCD